MPGTALPPLARVTSNGASATLILERFNTVREWACNTARQTYVLVIGCVPDDDQNLPVEMEVPDDEGLPVPWEGFTGKVET